jgi:hypothetical protein
MAILASQGISVTNGNNVALTPTGPNLVRSRTHDFAWDAFEWWANKPIAADSVYATISDGQVSLDAWLREFGYGTPGVAPAVSWLKKWSFDVEQATKDHNARNMASYTPSNYLDWTAPTPLETAKYLRGLWQLFDPSQSGSFVALDLFLIRMALETAFETKGGVPYTQDPVNFETQIEATIASVGYSGATASRLRGFILRQGAETNDPEVLKQANFASVDPQMSLSGLPVLSRAALLLRLSTGLARDLLRSAGWRAGDLSDWNTSVCRHIGLIDTPDPLPDPTDLWLDMEDNLEELDRWIAAGSNSRVNYRSTMSNVVWDLCTMERIPIWGMTL